MSQKSISQIKADLLREAMKTSGLQKTKPGILSKIYPATNHGLNHPPRRVDLRSTPPVDHSKDDADPKEVDTPSSPNLDRLSAAEVMMNARLTAHDTDDYPKQEEAHKISPFVQRCVAAITGGQPSSKDELSGAFGKCVATEAKSDKALSKDALARKGMTADKAKFVGAISKFKKQGHG